MLTDVYEVYDCHPVMVAGDNTDTHDRRIMCFFLQVVYPCDRRRQQENAQNQETDDIFKSVQVHDNLRLIADHSHDVPNPFVSDRACDRQKNRNTAPIVKSAPPTQSIRLSFSSLVSK